MQENQVKIEKAQDRRDLKLDAPTPNREKAEEDVFIYGSGGKTAFV